MRFIDEAIISVSAGNGGAGAATFHRAKFVPKGGPDGGDGGRGGSIIFKANPQISTLSDLSNRRNIKAKNGTPGGGNKRFGKNAKNIIIEIPVGTVIYDANTGDILADLIDPGQTVVVAKGGKGGRGNARFVTPTNRTPRKFEPGKPGESVRIRLEMKLLADVGLVGRPNAGKSTLLSALTQANPRIADYPFSTLSPGLGVVPYGIYQRFVIADIPGLAEGAADGKGLGHRFLRHIERTRLIVILIETPDTDYHTTLSKLITDMSEFSDKLAGLPRIIVKSKNDLNLTNETQNGNKIDVKFEHSISAISGNGLPELVDMIAEKLGLEKEIEY